MAALDRLVDALRTDRAGTAILVDFDGTLAPIVADPAAAVPLPDAAGVLRSLDERYGLVAVVSGRPVAYLRAHLPAGLVLAGLYGLELDRAGTVELHPAAAPWRVVVDDAAAAAVAELPAGVVVEHKGLSLTLHVRTSPELAPTVDAWAAATGERTGLLVRRARRSVELHPPISADKGTVVDDLVAGFSAACFIGDDVGDLPAFDALDRFAAGGGTALRVVVRSSETDAALLARADLVVDGPEAVLDLLGGLLAP